jgi:hypothetical protein
MIIQVINEESEGLSLRFRNLYTGLKIPVTTTAITITDKNGQRSHPSRKQDTRKMARKNHRMISRTVVSLTEPPEIIIFVWGCYATVSS